MLIGIDARELCGRPTGVGRYLERLLAAWAQLPEARAHEFLLLAPEPPASAPPLRCTLRVLPGGRGTRWEQLTLAGAVNRLRPHVLFAPGYSAPIRARVPVVLTLHDLSFLAHPEWFARRERLRRAWLARLSARKARLVLTVSEFIRSEIEVRLATPRARIRVIAHGIDARNAAGDQPDAAAGRREPMVLFVGSIFNRRNLPDLLGAFALLAGRHPEVRLEVVGDNRTHPWQDIEGSARALALGDRVRIRAYEPDHVIDGLYRRAGAFAFLSDYEGFGLPPLEALAAGIPVVLTDTPVAREVFGAAAEYVPRGDRAAVAARLEAVLFDQTVRRGALDRAPAVLARYSWERAARETLAALQEAAADRAGARRSDG